MAGVAIRIAAFTHTGAVRPDNEDCIVLGDAIRFGSMAALEDATLSTVSPHSVMVCDGMGGNNAGEVASRLAATTLAAALKRSHDEASLTEELRRVNRMVFEAADTAGQRGMGTTVAGLYVSPGQILWFNVGDSRIYRYRSGFMRQLSVDDSNGGGGGGITQALGGAETFIDIAPHIGNEPVMPGWRYLICSDGLTDMVAFDGIERELAKPAGEALQSLVTAAMAAGGRDNISIIIADIQGEPAAKTGERDEQ
jgi:serine/threonine protein phosphatase PrpC